MEFPTVLHKQVADLDIGRVGDLVPPQEENDVERLAGFGYLCYSGITKMENTSQPLKGVDYDLNKAASELVHTLKPFNYAYLGTQLMCLTPASEEALDAARAAFVYAQTDLHEYDTSDVDIQCVFIRKIRTVDFTKEQRGRAKPTSSDSDDDVADPSLDKRARTSKSVQTGPTVVTL